MLDDGDPGGLGEEGEEEEEGDLDDVDDSHVTGWRSTLLLGTVPGVLHDSGRWLQNTSSECPPDIYLGEAHWARNYRHLHSDKTEKLSTDDFGF